MIKHLCDICGRELYVDGVGDPMYAPWTFEFRLFQADAEERNKQRMSTVECCRECGEKIRVHVVQSITVMNREMEKKKAMINTGAKDQ